MKERLKELRERLKLSQTSIAKELGIPQSSYATYENKGSRFPADLLTVLMKKYKVNPDWLLFGNGDMFYETGSEVDRQVNQALYITKPESRKTKSVTSETSFIPLIDHKASAGSGIINHDDPEIREMIPVSTKLFNQHDPRNIKAIEVFGDSMENNGEGFCNGDLCFFTMKVEQKTDGIYIILLEDQIMLKRLQFTPGLITIISDNPKYKPIEIRTDDDSQIRFEIVGVVIGKLRLYR